MSPADQILLEGAPAELTRAPLRRIGEGIGKVVYASEHWVVKRERSPSEVVALIVVWRLIRKVQRFLPCRLTRDLLERPSRQIRFLRVMVQAAMPFLPKALWFTTRIRQVWRQYHTRSTRGERLAREQLAGTALVPRQVEFPPISVQVGGWPGWLTVSQATERVEATLYQRLGDLARLGSFDEVERWLDRFLTLRQSGWRRGLFSTDAHLKNFGVIGDRIVLLDAGGLTDRWQEIEERLTFEEVVAQPHIQLGLGPFLGARPDIAARFNTRWKSVVNRETVRELWPGEGPLLARASQKVEQ
ncbi:MAG: hypothetical protein SFV51_00860 [Bryobacteraceae bacterium]|nr:hypothetical protein [Bryobacteraceae bacterium]